MITVHFACGHELHLTGSSEKNRPSCIECGETRITRTMAPPPRFVGMCTGPVAVFNPAIPPHAAILKTED